MSRITHFKHQPMNIAFWDYYILCHLNSDVALALQRMEYWDGTKDESNTHAEAINDATLKAGQLPTQDTSNWIYKSLDELQWELLGIAGEKRLTKVINFLVDDLKYLRRRNNPLEGWDRKKQYEFQSTFLQEHINYLGYILSSFNLPTRYLRPVFYAIEVLTSEGISIETLSVEKVRAKIEQLKNEPKAPHFLKGDLEKWGPLSINQPGRSFRTFAEWKAHMCGMQGADSRNARRTNAECIPQIRGSNSIEDTYMTDREDKQRESTNPNTVSASETNVAIATTHTPLSFSSEEEMIIYLQAKGMTISTPESPVSAQPTAQENSPTEEHDPVVTNPQPKQGEPEGNSDSLHTQDITPGENQGTFVPPNMPWIPEKMVQITECMRFCRGERGAVFSTEPTGKSGKSQRDRQLAAARKIFVEIPTLTESEYVAAYSDQNNEWWNREKGSLTVEDMAASTPRKVMRAVELMEKVRTRSEQIRERPPSPVGSGPSRRILSPEELSKIPVVF